MESIVARAVEYTLKYWLKSFSRDQFKLQGRTVQLSNLDINGDAFHASVGLPPALNVATAIVGKLEITLPSVSNVQVEPIVVQIDRLDLVLEENQDNNDVRSSSSAQTSTSSVKGSGYGFADKVLQNASRMYRNLNSLAMQITKRGGLLMTCSCSGAMTQSGMFLRVLQVFHGKDAVSCKERRERVDSPFEDGDSAGPVVRARGARARFGPGVRDLGTSSGVASGSEY